MTTIADVEFGSESDEDYELSSHSTSSEEEAETERPTKRRKLTFDADKALSRLKANFAKSTRRDVVLGMAELKEWQVKKLQPRRRNESYAALDNYVALNLSRPQTSLVDSPGFDLASFKAGVRRESHSNTRKGDDVDLSTSKIKVTRTVKYAGQVTTIEQELDRNSLAYRNYVRKERAREDLGDMAAIAAAVETTKVVNTVEKSEADWAMFRASNPALADSMEAGRKAGFRQQQAFLLRNEEAEHEQFKKVRKAYERKRLRDEQGNG